MKPRSEFLGLKMTATNVDRIYAFLTSWWWIVVPFIAGFVATMIKGCYE